MTKRGRGRPRKSGPRKGFALRFWRARRALGLSQAAAAAALGVATSTVGRWEIGETEPQGAGAVLMDRWIAEAMRGKGRN